MKYAVIMIFAILSAGAFASETTITHLHYNFKWYGIDGFEDQELNLMVDCSLPRKTHKAVFEQADSAAYIKSSRSRDNGNTWVLEGDTYKSGYHIDVSTTDCDSNRVFTNFTFRESILLGFDKIYPDEDNEHNYVVIPKMNTIKRAGAVHLVPDGESISVFELRPEEPQQKRGLYISLERLVEHRVGGR